MAWLTALLTLPVKLVTAATNWFLGLSLPARIAWSVGVVQFLLCLVTLLLVIVSGGRTTFQAWWTPGKGMQLLILLLLVPIFVYYAMRLWLHEEVSRWRDIEKAWREVRIELDRQQIDLRDVPLFLILGTDGRDEERGYDDRVGRQRGHLLRGRRGRRGGRGARGPHPRAAEPDVCGGDLLAAHWRLG